MLYSLFKALFVSQKKNISHTGEKKNSVLVLHSLELHGRKLGNCRGQTFDNAANMSGKYSGLQA